MQIDAEKFTISLRRPFRIAHGSSDTRDTLLARVSGGGCTGHGEGALPPYYPSRAEDGLKWISKLTFPELPEGIGLAELVSCLPPAPPEAAAARVAVEIALCDWWAQRRGQPLWKIWGLDPEAIPPVARTIPICESVAELNRIMDEDPQTSFLKLKLGSGDLSWDEESIRQARSRFPDAEICVDVNEGWTAPQAASLLKRVAGCRLAFVEQPVPRDLAAWKELHAELKGELSSPLVLDESLQSEEDLLKFQGLAQGVNVKLLKAGGLVPARRWVKRARELGYRVMVGVMVETGIGRSAAAQLAPLCDWLDIDPPGDIPVEPLCGFRVKRGRLELSESAGLGLRPV